MDLKNDTKKKKKKKTETTNMRCSFPEDFDHSFTIGGPSSYESIDLSDHKWPKHTMRVGNVGTRNSIIAFVEYEPCLAEVCDYFCRKVMIFQLKSRNKV